MRKELFDRRSVLIRDGLLYILLVSIYLDSYVHR